MPRVQTAYRNLSSGLWVDPLNPEKAGGLRDGLGRAQQELSAALKPRLERVTSFSAMGAFL
jgi:hypothetical protein